MTTKKTVSLECSSCGGDAGRFQQFWNQDDGYGMCPRCIDEIVARGLPAENECSGTEA